ncbi:hypothetical protein AVEN_234490-2 [Araneus ventricosus]|uniref:Uncharacterized protein n=1 Tax=Araneus ventricosus TaxID=182803 RepID=A0A4Y2A8S1_ARAVE|nr:hypothetical protein AVEN_234490-2 [Araneus ventricosus]
MEEEVANFIPCLILSCLQHTDAHFYFKAELSKLIESDMFESISDCVMHFYIAFDAEYKAIIEKVFENPQFMKSKSRFLIKIGSRCLKMCDDPTFFNFLLMCAFVGRVVSFCYTNGKCYRVVENACKCAVATFKRKFLELFNREGDLNGLRMYSDGLNETVLDRQDQYDDLKDILCPDLEGKQLVLRLLENCKDVDSDQYFLTDFERKLLYKVTKKRLRKLKPNLDFLICRIPRKYFQMQNNQYSQNVMHNVFGSNLVDIESNLRAEYRMRGDNPLLSPPSISCRTDSWSLPINYTTKRNSEPSNYCIIEKRSEPSNYCIIEKRSEPSNYCIIEKRSEPSNYCIIEKRSETSNCFIIGNKSESLECCITEKRFEPSNCCVIEKQPELSNCCITKNEIEPLNYCIAKKDSELSIKETIPEGSLSLVNHKTSREEFQSANFETSSKQPKSATQSPRMLKRSSSGRSMNPELSKRGDRISPNYLQIGTSPKTDTASFSKRPKISNSPQSKLSLETSFTSSQQQFLPPSLDSPQTALYLPFSFSTFEDKSPNTKRCSLEMEVELSKKYSSKFRITSDEDHSIQNYPSTSSFNGNFLPFELQTEAQAAVLIMTVEMI